MVNYRCLNCNRLGPSKMQTTRLRCMFCGYKVFTKTIDSEKPKDLIAR